MRPGELDGRTALVTGASGAIGSEVAIRLAASGARVAVHYGSRREEAEELVERLDATGSTACAIQADLADERGPAFLVARATEAFGSPDVLVHCAGLLRARTVQRLAVEDWDAMQAVNLRASFLLVRACVQEMMERRFGRIVGVASVAALGGWPMQAGYAAAKAGLIGLLKSVARETARYGVTCNVVAPGYVPSRMSSLGGDTALEPILAATPMGRAGTAGEVAAAVCFLCSPDASFVTGQVLAVDGGLSM